MDADKNTRAKTRNRSKGTATDVSQCKDRVGLAHVTRPSLPQQKTTKITAGPLFLYLHEPLVDEGGERPGVAGAGVVGRHQRDALDKMRARE